jgi:hypothetical protein
MHYQATHSGVGSLNARYVYYGKKYLIANPSNRRVIVEYETNLLLIWVSSYTRL